MKRIHVLLIGAALPLLFAFTSVLYQTARIEWVAVRVGDTAPPNGTALLPQFRKNLSPTGDTSYGDAIFRVGGFQCVYGTAGTDDGGTNTLSMRIQHNNNDGGVGTECECSVGSCTSINTQLHCDCGMHQLTGDLEWYVTYSSPSGCLTNPTHMLCEVDLFR
jgi:hypothetical protein